MNEPDIARDYAERDVKAAYSVLIELGQVLGAWREKSLYGRKYMGVARITALIDEAGVVAQVWDPVKAAGHAEQVLAAL